MPNITLQALISPWPELSLLLEKKTPVLLDAICLDHRIIKPGSLFIALQGHQIDARDYIPLAIKAGAVAVLADLGDEGEFYCQKQQGAWVLGFVGLKKALSTLGARFYHKDSLAPMPLIIGITGTNGKTTVSQLIAQWLNLLGNKIAVMGTTGNGFLDALTVSANTTGSALDIQKAFASYRDQNASHIAMEVSSHGLVQHRVSAVDFSAVVFTNLSRDHLDYHGTMQAYEAAKLTLLTDYKAEFSVINADDNTGQKWLSLLPKSIGVSLSKNALASHLGPKLWATHITYSNQGFELEFSSSWGDGRFSCRLVGEFNVTNVLLSLATLLALGADKKALLNNAKALEPVIGRMEVFTRPGLPLLVVDYAHTPDALEKALLALKRHCKGKLWCVFGCGGDRDKGKRPLMGKVAEKIVDKLIITDDNPRSESPLAIVEDIKQGLKVPALAKVIHERQKAIEYAFHHAKEQDVILIAGKGHEYYQITQSGILPYSDRDTARLLIQEGKK